MKKVFLGIAFIATIIIFNINWQKPPVEYVIIEVYPRTVKYWDDTRRESVKCGSVQEAMNRLSWSGFKFQGISTSSAAANNQDMQTFGTIIMAK